MEEKEFRDYLSAYTDADKCLSCFRSQKTFFRVNTIKIGVDEFRARSKLECEPSPAYGAAFELSRDLPIGRTWEYFLGLIHPQSMPSILASLALAPSRGETILDAASAPGSKLSHMAMLMENRGVVVGNDLKREKVSAIFSTINRLNVLNCVVTSMDGGRLPWRDKFDKILLDAPCTALGSGMGAYERWEPGNSAKIAELQKRMLRSAYSALKPGGALVYSTCTYAREENEEVVVDLLGGEPGARLEETGIDAPHEPGLSEFGPEFRKCMRIYPQHLMSEGFFIARIRRPA